MVLGLVMVLVGSACTAYSWGNNQYGQLGDGTTTDRATPGQIGTATDWSSMSAARNHSCGVRTNATLWCWGDNGSGQLGDGTATDRSVPTQVGTAADWSSVSAGGGDLIGGGGFSCGVRADATLWCWGDNQFGQLGDGTTTDRSVPTQVGTAVGWSSVSAGVFHTCGVRADATLWCWGANGSGELGDGTTTDRSVPSQVGASAGWSSVSAGLFHTCGVRADATLWCWGDNQFGQLGDGTTTGRSVPTQVGTAAGWSSVSAGAFHTVGLRTGLGGPDPCDKTLVLGVRGSGETAADWGGFGGTVRRAIDGFSTTIDGGYETVAVDYTAMAVPDWYAMFLFPGPALFGFAVSIVDGISALESTISSRAVDCPNQRVVLFGYSQGALVIRLLLDQEAAAASPLINRVIGVGLIADPDRLGSSSFNTGTARADLNGIWRSAPLLRESELPVSLYDETVSRCDDGDGVCAFDLLDPFEFGEHTLYDSEGEAFFVGETIGTRAAARN